MPFSFPEHRILLLDGGFGTTLEDVFNKDISGALWSASLIDKEPETIIDAHLAFLNSGSDVILTATYQCAFETFERAGYSKQDAVELMRKAVRLAVQAKDKYHAAGGTKKNIQIVLSLGPFGATLSPAQEFDGIYPPPYGPRGYQAGGTNTNAFTDSAAEEAAIDHLTAFHYERLKVFADVEKQEDGDGIWSLIDGVAFETVPLAREITAIRRAVGLLNKDLGTHGGETKPWWIGTVWPGGVHPQEATPGGARLTVEEVAHALLYQDPNREHLPNDANGLPLPDGIGINCTHITDSEAIVPQLRNAVDEISPSKKPFLVLYPNGGGAYDIVHHVWLSQEGTKQSAEGNEKAWAKQLAYIAERELEVRTWKGLILGGCCKTNPTHIKLLDEVSKIPDS